MYFYENSLNKVIKFFNGNILSDETFFKVYSFTTENISEYIKYFDLINKKLLTVGSSGDQILNAYYYGARDITLFDINEFSKYYIYLKISAIISLDYLEFQKFFFKHGYDIDEDYYNKNRFNKDIFNTFKSTLRLFDYEAYLFFDELFSNYSLRNKSDYLFDDDEDRNRVIRGFNIYLKDEESYNKLKNKLKSISFKFINGDIFKDNINGLYDNIFLSNLCTWYSINELKELIEKMDKNNLNINGSMLICYLYYTNFYNNEYNQNYHKIYDMKHTREYLKKYITEHHQIKDGRSKLWEEEKKEDCVLIYRKK